MSTDLEALKESVRRALRAHIDDLYNIQLRGYQVFILNGLVALAMDHPALQDRVSPGTVETGAGFRSVCKLIFMEMGLSAEDAQLLDRLREQ